MNNKGFTLIELLVVIIILALISTLGYTGITAFNNNIKKNLWEEKMLMIEKAAVDYGNDNKNILTGNCTVNGINYNGCITIKVQDLINNGYITTKEYDDNNNKVVTNDTLDINDQNYYANNMLINVYIKNTLVYANLVN